MIVFFQRNVIIMAQQECLFSELRFAGDAVLQVTSSQKHCVSPIWHVQLKSQRRSMTEFHSQWSCAGPDIRPPLQHSQTGFRNSELFFLIPRSLHKNSCSIIYKCARGHLSVWTCLKSLWMNRWDFMGKPGWLNRVWKISGFTVTVKVYSGHPGSKILNKKEL